MSQCNYSGKCWAETEGGREEGRKGKIPTHEEFVNSGLVFENHWDVILWLRTGVQAGDTDLRLISIQLLKLKAYNEWDHKRRGNKTKEIIELRMESWQRLIYKMTEPRG